MCCIRASTLSQLFVRSFGLACPCSTSSHRSASTHHIMLAASHINCVCLRVPARPQMETQQLGSQLFIVYKQLQSNGSSRSSTQPWSLTLESTSSRPSGSTPNPQPPLSVTLCFHVRPHPRCLHTDCDCPAVTLPGTPTPLTSSPTLQPHVSTTHVGTTSHSQHCSPQKECCYRPFGTHPAISAEARAGRGPFPKPNAYYHTHGKIRTAQTCWARSPPQCRQ